MYPPAFTAKLQGSGPVLTLPITVITSPDQKTVYAKLAMKDMLEKSTFRAVKKDLKKIKKGGESTYSLDENLKWSKSNGSYIIGKFVKIEGENLVIQKDKDKTTLKLSELTSGAVAYAKTMSERASKK